MPLRLDPWKLSTLTLSVALAFSLGSQLPLAEAAGPVSSDRAGYLRVAAVPWADVYVDGQKVATTPTADRIALTPGVHYVRFTNPYFKTLDREVKLQAGEVRMVTADLVPESRAAGSAP